LYSDIVKDHFSNPRNVGELESPDAVGTAKNEADGDRVQLHFRIEDGRIVNVKMKVMGCVAAIASTSMLTEMVKGKSVEDALAVTREELVDRLGGLPERKVHCSLTCINALQKAVGEEET
jgi:nitrogen fixation NifU-like protein